VAACSPLIARFYGEPRLTMIALVSALTFIASGLTCQHYALMRRAMKFEELAAMDVGANLLSAGTAIAMAFHGFGYWALVLRPVMMTSLLAIFVWLRCRWLPPKPAMTTGAKEMLRFGLHSTGFTVLDFVGRSSDRVAIGYRSGATALGYYQNASFLYENLLDVLVAPLHGVAVTSLSKARDDLEELRRLWRKALLTLEFYAMPAFGLLAVISQDLVVLLLGAKWSHAGLLLSILALRGIPHTVERTLGWLHVTAGRTDRWMRWGVIATCAHLIALFSGLPFGATGVTVAYVICMFLLFIPTIVYAGRPLGIGASAVISVVWRPLVGSLLAVVVGFILRFTLLVDAPGMVTMAALTTAYATVYLVTVVGLLRVRMPIGVVLALLRDVLPSRFAHLVRTPRFMEGHE
jgi:PST family polysaccharide transporter